MYCRISSADRGGARGPGAGAAKKRRLCSRPGTCRQTRFTERARKLRSNAAMALNRQSANLAPNFHVCNVYAMRHASEMVSQVL